MFSDAFIIWWYTCLWVVQMVNDNGRWVNWKMDLQPRKIVEEQELIFCFG